MVALSPWLIPPIDDSGVVDRKTVDDVGVVVVATTVPGVAVLLVCCRLVVVVVVVAGDSKFRIERSGVRTVEVEVGVVVDVLVAEPGVNVKDFVVFGAEELVDNFFFFFLLGVFLLLE